MHSIGGVFSVALSPGFPEFALRTTVPCGVRTFLSGGCRSDHASIPIFREKGSCVFFVYPPVGHFVGPFILCPEYMSNTPVIQLCQQDFYLVKQAF